MSQNGTLSMPCVLNINTTFCFQIAQIFFGVLRQNVNVRKNCGTKLIARFYPKPFHLIQCRVRVEHIGSYNHPVTDAKQMAATRGLVLEQNFQKIATKLHSDGDAGANLGFGRYSNFPCWTDCCSCRRKSMATAETMTIVTAMIMQRQRTTT